MVASGIYVKISENDEFIGIDEDYIELYINLASKYNVDIEPISVNIDLRTIPCNKVRPTLKWIEKVDESIKTIFIQTSIKFEM